MVKYLQVIWTRIVRMVSRLRAFDPRQCNDGQVGYDMQHLQESGADGPDFDPHASRDSAIVEHQRANEAKVGKDLRDHYDRLVDENLPHYILETLADLNHRLNRRDGD